ncbi:TPM domain-containing protein, partial [Staphylococcus aureus]|uniref:TPM domain-containing protein n=1 Tax=Staphylococcus aureus TaxID=1280 RepID=UPI0018A1ED56
LILLTFGLALPVSAAENSIDDGAQLLTPDQINQLKQEIQPLEEKTKASVFIVTTNNNTYGDEQEYADHYLLNKVGKDQNAILCLIDRDLRKVYISTSGYMIDYMRDARINDSLDKVMDGMSQGNCFAAAQPFFQETQAFVNKGVPGGRCRVDSATG